MRRGTGRRGIASALAVGIALTGLAACDGEDSDESDQLVATPLAERFSVLGALAQLPSSTPGLELDSAVISVGDLDRASEAAGVERPEDGSRDAWIAWIQPLTGMEPSKVYVPLPAGFNVEASSPEEFAEVAGWSVNDVSSFAEISSPPHQLTVVQGVDDDVLADSLVDTGDGLRSSREGEDLEQDLASVSAVDRLGRPIRFLQRDDMVGFGTSTDLVRAWADGAESLADDDSFAAVAAALDGEAVVSAALTRITGGGVTDALGSRLSPEQLAQVQAEVEPMIPDAPYDVVGIGWAADGEVHVAYHFADGASANDGADVLEKAWREGTSVQSRRPMSDFVEVEEVSAEDDDVVVVALSPVDQRAQIPWQMLVQREPVFVSR